MKSLKSQGNKLASTTYQIDVLENITHTNDVVGKFTDKLQTLGMYPLKPATLEILQVNVGKMCNQTCTHCHVDAGPDRKEIMTQETMQHCLNAIQFSKSINTVDLTGGAPEMNPHFKWFVEELSKLNVKVIVRSNLTILVSNKKYHDYVDFFAKHGVTVIASLPCYTAENTDKQRGDGVFSKSIEALKMLNSVGYGKEGSGLELNLVFNPGGASLPPPEQQLQAEYKKILYDNFNLLFNNLYTITNLPISRFLEYLLVSEKYEQYMEKLVKAFNPSTVKGLMCRNTLSVSWDGNLFDCDFNQMLDLPVETNNAKHIKDFSTQDLYSRNIVLNQHCYGCTAGAGSSCQGSIM